MNDITVLQAMLVSDAKVTLPTPIDENKTLPSVKLTDDQSKSAVEIKGLPRQSIIIRAEYLKDPLTLFAGDKGERKRADFIIVSHDEKHKWIICIETQATNSKTRAHVVQQLKGAQCLMWYCTCIGRAFWGLKEFLKEEQCHYRFVSIVNITGKKQNTRPRYDSRDGSHDVPEKFLKCSGHTRVHFRRLTGSTS